MYGDFIRSYYKSYAFHFTKIITSIYRGLIDNQDYDSEMNSFTFTNNHQGNNLFEITKHANGSYLNLLDFKGEFGYIIYGLIFYVFIKYVVVAIHLSVYIISYRKERKSYINANKKKKV